MLSSYLIVVKVISYNVGIYIFFELGFHCLTLWGASFAPKFIFHIVCRYQFHLCHNTISFYC